MWHDNNIQTLDDTLSNPFKSHLGEDAVYNFINRMVEESKYCSDVTKKHFNNEQCCRF